MKYAKNKKDNLRSPGAYAQAMNEAIMSIMIP